MRCVRRALIITLSIIILLNINVLAAPYCSAEEKTTLLDEKLNITKSTGNISELPNDKGTKNDEIKVDNDIYKVGKANIEGIKQGDEVTIYFRDPEKSNSDEKTLGYIHKTKELSKDKIPEFLSALEILKGDENGELDLASNVTRAEFCTILVRSLGLERWLDGTKEDTKFKDVTSSHWASAFIAIASQTGIVNGYDTDKFAPEDPVSIEQAVAMIIRGIGYGPVAMTKGGYPDGYMIVAKEQGIIDDVKNIVDRNATRMDVGQMIYNTITTPIMEMVESKPVIYLYPQTESKVSVKLNLKGSFIYTYPKYDDGWEVIAKPDGTLINLKDNKEYSYLFWEGETNNVQWDLSKGFVIKGENTTEFLQEKLSAMGLTPKEYNEFIVYWAPKMQNNKYNLVTFAGQEYEQLAPLDITPKPDSMLRVFMVYKPLDQPIDIKEQVIAPFERKGFTVVEWGGTEIQ